MRYRSKLDLDYKQSLANRSQKKHHYGYVFAIGGAAVMLMGAVIPNVNFTQTETTAGTEISHIQIDTIPLPLKAKADTADLKYSATARQQPRQETASVEKPHTTLSKVEVETITIKKGDSLSSLFNQRGLNSELHYIMRLGDKVKQLTSIHPGQKFHFYLKHKTLIGIELETSANKRLKISRQAESYRVDEVVRDFEIRTQTASSTIKNSLFLAGQKAGLSDPLIMQLANVFGWDIDFALDIRSGDQFSIIYEEKYLDGEKIKDGNIVAAEFINAGQRYRAVRYTDSQGKTDYFAPDGRSMRKPFLRMPVDFARISSKFNLKRRHPILNRIRAHTGVDYAASTGTPIKASGDGKIIHRGNKGGYGRTIIVKHGIRYSTLYAHMQKYARNTQVGKRVKQGQIIGYVGKSGLATGPHLHYEFRINGVHRNPLTVKLPAAKPLPEAEMNRFKSATSAQFARLDLYSSTLVAQHKHGKL